ncbi:uncharacterized protein K452DRAFT_152430 [Aplosporella prunicola CBS 121167]|uniref:WSC domain-containing protein n=1 Tax=Aplosporella prunicola CBS 121167 TaxID=1176127 RepID=A0A6A6BIV7_9PEZI|nr:uncharacterized protein K452DRAFT_152430 [Aplosporella prunicola CBS 121167]KAF2144072.1 hypothetical protein K452DRAFT_152430 [Aplosporella prunicola CBS 121167]
MRLQQPPRLIRVLHLLSILPFFVGSAQALTQKYCSTQNTGSGNSQGTSVYQTTGLCHDACVDKYAFAVIQGNACWCSNYVPAAQSSTDSCDQTCPGYPSENCGSTDNSLYGYIALNISPSGTIGASSSAATSTSTHKTSTVS